MGETDPQECTDGDTSVMLYAPKFDELLSSWIIRNSIAHGTDPMGWVYGFWGEWRAWTRDIDRFIPEDKIVQLARFSRLSPAEIRDLTLVSSVKRMLGEVPDIHQPWQWIIPTGKRNRSVVSGLQFCPECLSSPNLFFPKQWRFSWYTQCPVHNMQLLDRCDRCGLPFSPHLIDYTAPSVYLCHRCGSDLRSAETVQSPPRVLALQNTLSSMLTSSSSETKHFTRWHADTIEKFFLFLRDILVLTAIIARKHERYAAWQSLLLGRATYGKPVSKAGLSFDMRSVKERAQILSLAAALLERDPVFMTECLRRIGMTQALLNEHTFPKSPLMRDLLFSLPPRTAVRVPASRRPKPRSKEPRSAEAIEKEMSAIRRFL